MPRTAQTTKPSNSTATTTSTLAKNKIKGRRVKKTTPSKGGITKKTTRSKTNRGKATKSTTKDNTKKAPNTKASEKKKKKNKAEGREKTKSKSKASSAAVVASPATPTVATKKRRSSDNPSFGAMHMELQYQQQISNATKILNRPVCKGIESPISIMKDSGLARGAVLLRADILRANENAMNALSRCLSLEHKKLARLLYSIKVAKFLEQERQKTDGTASSQAVSPRIKDRNVKQAYEQMGIIYLA